MACDVHNVTIFYYKLLEYDRSEKSNFFLVFPAKIQTIKQLYLARNLARLENSKRSMHSNGGWDNELDYISGPLRFKVTKPMVLNWVRL